jgi:hypothetical protein
MNYSADTYTYGSPRVGNTVFATFVTNQAPKLGGNYRMTHVNDPVPQLPPTWIGYEHTSPEYWLANGTDTADDYSAGDVVVCEGVGNESCNAGTGLVPIDGTAHDHYLGAIDTCQGPLEWWDTVRSWIKCSELLATGISIARAYLPFATHLELQAFFSLHNIHLKTTSISSPRTFDHVRRSRT